MSAFLRELQQCVDQRDKATLSELMHYPLLVNVRDEQQQVSAPDEFVRRYDELMPALLEQEIANATPATLFVNSSGIMLGRGQLWFAKVCPDDACTLPLIRVIAISAPIPSN